MEPFYELIDAISNFVWGGVWGGQQIIPITGPVAYLLLGTGLYFMIRLGARPLRRFGPAIVEVWQGRKGDGSGAITPWQALSTALSGQVGTGNLAGVATAIALGGPGAIFWMWITAIFGMALAFAESSLAVKFRETDEYGRINGGPMYYIKNGLGKNWGWLAILFCIGTLFSALATGGMIQSNSITQSVVQTGESLGVGVPTWVVGLVVASLVFAVIIGGIKSIGSFAGKIVPFMALAYVLSALVVLILNYEHIGDAFILIFRYAFGLEQAAAGAAGYSVLAAIRYGVARGLFSNEAGQGSAPIAHAAAETNNPVKQGEIAMIGVFIDTIVICTMTALVILVVDGNFANSVGSVEYAWQSDTLEASAVTTAAYAAGIPGGQWIVTISLAVFAFTTIIGWSYYAEQAITYLIGEWATHPVRFVWVIVIFVGSLQPVDFIWRLGDIANASMLFPNVIALIALSSVVLAMHRANHDPDKVAGDASKESAD